jgi:hypothetical protein
VRAIAALERVSTTASGRAARAGATGRPNGDRVGARFGRYARIASRMRGERR